mgnify:CR=1 FL=1
MKKYPPAPKIPEGATAEEIEILWDEHMAVIEVVRDLNLKRADSFLFNPVFWICAILGTGVAFQFLFWGLGISDV